MFKVDKPCQDLQASETLKKNTKAGHIRSKSSIQSIFLCVAPVWVVCFFILTAYIQCIHEHSPEENPIPHFFSPSRNVHVNLANLALNVPTDQTTAAPTTTTPSPAQFVTSDFPDIQFSAENHGVQIFVSTLPATQAELKKDDISWVTQLTTDRLDIFSQMLQRWSGPASVTIYCRNLTADLAAIAPFRERVDFHLVLADFHAGRLYPVNTLRNVAIDNCRTNWMLLVDADFVPNMGLYEQLLPHVPAWERGENAVYVVAAFQLQHGETRVPLNKTQLLAMGDRVSQVHPEKGRDIAHKHTNYPKWRTANAIYEVQYRMPYEPYFVTNKRVPRYDTNFLGYGNDKTEHCKEIFVAKIKYLVLPDAFVFHVNHPRGDWLSSDQSWLSRSRAALSHFLVDVQDRYGMRTEGAVEAIAGPAGENCSHVCGLRGKGCRADLARHINTCEALLAAFGDRCRDGCSHEFFGNDLPAFNLDHNRCLVNSKFAQYPTACDLKFIKSERLCPCGERLEQWLTPQHIVSTLSQEGAWDKVSQSITDAL